MHRKETTWKITIPCIKRRIFKKEKTCYTYNMLNIQLHKPHTLFSIAHAECHFQIITNYWIEQKTCVTNIYHRIQAWSRFIAVTGFPLAGPQKQALCLQLVSFVPVAAVHQYAVELRQLFQFFSFLQPKISVQMPSVKLIQYKSIVCFPTCDL